MKKNNLIIPFIILMAFSSQFAFGQDTLNFQTVVNQINESLEQAQKELVGIELKSASVTLSVIASSQKGAGFKIFGKGSAKWSKENSSSVTLNFKKIPASTKKSFITSALTQTIINAANAYKETKDIKGLSKEDFNVEISFSASRTGTAGVEFELFGIGFDGSGERGKSAVHKINLTFK